MTLWRGVVWCGVAPKESDSGVVFHNTFNCFSSVFMLAHNH